MPRVRELDYNTVTITPQMASDWLEKHANEKNRTLRQRKVNTYAGDMKSRKWDLNGETIIIGSDETILDGHHRLWACVMADVPFTTAIVRGVDPEKFKSIDTGGHRTGADVIHIAGTHKYQRQIATACSLIMRYNSGKVIHNMAMLPREISDYFDGHPDVQTWIEASCRGDMKQFTAPISAVAYLAAGKYRSRCVEFVDGLVTGADLKKGSPVLALRNRLMLNGKERLNSIERFALVIQGWNAFVEGRPLMRMQMFTGDKFPKIKGASV